VSVVTFRAVGRNTIFACSRYGGSHDPDQLVWQKPLPGAALRFPARDRYGCIMRDRERMSDAEYLASVEDLAWKIVDLLNEQDCDVEIAMRALVHSLIYVAGQSEPDDRRDTVRFLNARWAMLFAAAKPRMMTTSQCRPLVGGSNS
jgi:hypothetical protein